MSEKEKESKSDQIWRAIRIILLLIEGIFFKFENLKNGLDILASALQDFVGLQLIVHELGPKNWTSC